MIRRIILISILLNVFFINGIYASPNSKILNQKGIKLVPVLVKDGKVFIQPFAGVNKEKYFYLLGNDSKIYDLQIKIKEVKEYKDVDWGYGDNKAILLNGKSLNLPKGYLVSIGKESRNILKWHQIDIINKDEKDFASEAYISKDNFYGMKKQIIYSCANIEHKLYFASYRQLKMDHESCDPKSYKDTIGLIAKNGKTKVILNSFADCDGQPGRTTNIYFPIGPILGTLEIKDKGKKEIWIVAEGHGYETIGISFIQYYPYSSFNKSRYDFMCTDGL
jgi:hypothetical protein